MKFHLDHIPAKPGFEIDHASKVFLTGSCFSENIGRLLQEHKFKTYANPSGILFNPVSIYHTLKNSIQLNTFDEKYLLNRGDLFLSYLHHSSVNSTDKNALTAKINAENETAHAFLKTADHLIITFGSAYFYEHINLNAAVANCHKQAGSLFEKTLPDANDIVCMYAELVKELQRFNPSLKLIFTVSPVKHLKDGLVENNLSKATLILSIHKLTGLFDNCFYFPAYELVNDDLRDYRFYKEDLAHPNEQAIDYVWQKFSGCFFNADTLQLNQKINRLNLAMSHRDMHGNIEESQKLQEFIARQKEEILRSNSGIEL